MGAFTGFLKILVLVVVLLAAGSLTISNYEWVFSKRVTGKVVDVARVTDPTAIIGSRATEAQMYSYSILIQGEDGQFYTSASEDRKWQVVKKGYCVDALLYRYPPWHLAKANTFFNAQLKEIKICPGETSLPMDAPGPTGPREGQPSPPQPAPVPAH